MADAISDPYATPQEYRDRAGRSDDGHDAEIFDQLVGVSRWLDSKLGRFFTRDAAPVARLYFPPGYAQGDAEAENPWRGTSRSRWLDVDDIASTTGLSITVDDNRTGSFAGYTPLAFTDYQLYPLNADKGPEPRPWTRIFLPPWSSRQSWTSSAPVEVTAVWGWPSVPRAIREATCVLTAIWRLETPRATSRIQEGLEGAIETSREAQRIVIELSRNYGKAETVI